MVKPPFFIQGVFGILGGMGPDQHDARNPTLLRSVAPYPALPLRSGTGRRTTAIDAPREICVSGPSLMTEYWNEPEATTEALIDGSYRSGDGGRLDRGGRA
ncbi:MULTISPECIES: AMP-binding protein [Sphingobium]|uniref:AMP-binding protein n=1 Tax=Sphingobium sp. MI1205 TaxID=407020 RepID=UPI000785885A|nr:AMP-binding protein [Sphingobium sp. MI1205]